MIEITYQGEKYKFEPFEYNNDNLRKVHLDAGGEGTSEGIWAVIHPDYVKVYDDEFSHNEPVICFLSNASINGLPWGTYIVCETKGELIPSCRINQLSGDLQKYESKK